MGALHGGHVSLIRASKQQNDLTIVSIFVNPTQFNSADDLANYPRDVEKDRKLLEAEGCDWVFVPNEQEMYPEPSVTSVHFGELEGVLEGAERPGHFKGVGIVVSKFFHIVNPQRAYFGMKDMQQVAIIRRLVKDLMFPVEIIAVPTVREANGLAMSSRNERLSLEGRRAAAVLYASLNETKRFLLSGRSPVESIDEVSQKLRANSAVTLEYLHVVNSHTLEPLEYVHSAVPTSICIAAWIGGVRLIDNLSVFE